jgi:hypothetical protein
LKKFGATKVKDFHPISLVSGVYKIIAKFLPNRLSRVVEKIISKIHNAFVIGRQILDFILIANECLDKVNLEFLLYLLRRCSFGEKYHSWIEFCISLVRFFVLVNDNPYGLFSSS